MKHLVLVNAESVLGLVHETLLRAAMNGLVLTAAELVADGLSIGLAGVWLRATSDLVGRSGDAFLGLVEGRFRGVGSLGNPTLVLLEVPEEKGAYHLLTSLGVEVLPECVGHVESYLG
jgi:hypothetical protein